MNTAAPASADPFGPLQPGSSLPLPADGHFRDAVHVWSEPELRALRLACAARRPLLLRGEPGCGKTQLARAAAKVLTPGTGPLVAVIHPRFEATDLLYTFDHVRRLMDAQLAARPGAVADEGLDPSNERYLGRGVLWRAFEQSQQGQQRPVVLIDEIDKAEADLPNALLDVLANRSFEVPMRPEGQRRIQADDRFAPLVLFTTNEERELPAAFVRRCMVLNLNPPPEEQPQALKVWMLQRLRSHAMSSGKGQTPVSDAVLQTIVAQTLVDRAAAARDGYPKVGLAEAVDLLCALQELSAGAPARTRQKEQLRLLGELSAYALVKHPVAAEAQARVPVQPVLVEQAAPGAAEG